MIAAAYRGALPWLVAGTILFAFSQGRWAVPLLAFVAPVLLVRFVRLARPLTGYLGFAIAHTAAWELAYLGMVPLPAFARIGLFFGLSLMLGLVMLADRWAATRLPALPASLVLPCGWVAFEFAIGLTSPNGTWGSLGYSLSEWLPVAQLASVTGWTGLSFVPVWIASVANQLIDRRPGARGSAIACAVFSVAVLAWGSVRLLDTVGAGEPLRAAAVVAPGTFDVDDIDPLWYYTRGVEQDAARDALARARIAESMAEHFALARQEAQRGATLVVWAEANLVLTEAERDAWLREARAVATEEAVYLGMGAMVFQTRPRAPTENTFVLVDPQGDIAWEFIKATRAPGSGNAKGDGVLPALDTAAGRWSAAICFDLDFPRLIAQAGRMNADLFIAPSNDWPEVAETHLRMHVIRAIEQGFVLFRPTKDGISASVDPYGRVLARLDTTVATDKVLRVRLPTSGMRTVYSRIGDAFSWGCAGLFFGLLILAGRGRGRARNPESMMRADSPR